ncbi:MAG: hypothetical protein ACTSRK_01465 [Promethearchaeota archaeon]
MVHNKDDILRKLANDFNKGEANSVNSDVLIQPEWTIDDDGIPYCTMQTNYDKIMEAQLKKRFPHEFEKMLHCEHCNHYKQDNCYFPKSEIDKIEQDRNNLKIRCQLCGMKIDRPFSILMSLYYKAKFGVNMPVICCSCYASLENNTFEKNSKRRMILFAVSLFTSIYFLFTNFLSLFTFKLLGFLFFLIPLSFWGYITIRDMKNIYYLRKGRKFYRQIMNAETAKVDIDAREQYLDEDDKKEPESGSYNSPGYEY